MDLGTVAAQDLFWREVEVPGIDAQEASKLHITAGKCSKVTRFQ
jgi:hypothetical protein